MRVLVAVSGGVDSSVALARAAAAGHDVTAVHLALTTAVSQRDGSRTCCSPADVRDARRVADVVGVPFYVWDVVEEFRSAVVGDFLDEYASGRTPNPCLRCNERIKFDLVLDRALALGFDAVATGHYARLETGRTSVSLRRAVDTAKDQSYVLAGLGPRALRHSMFPLGDTVKAVVRREAARLGLVVAAKPDSHDICFIPDGDTRSFLRERIGSQPGPIVDADSGEVLGRHDGTYGFTIGQRRGLGLIRPGADGRPRYVVGLDPRRRSVTVGGRKRLEVRRISARDPVWCGPIPSAGDEVLAQIRAHGVAAPAEVVDRTREGFSIRVERPFVGVAAGQSCVLYDDDRVLGQGTITATAEWAEALSPDRSTDAGVSRT